MFWYFFILSFVCVTIGVIIGYKFKKDLEDKKWE